MVLKRSQLWLPMLAEYERVVNYPQPKLIKFKSPKKFELMYHPLDLRFRGRIGKWIKGLERLEKIRLKDFLTRTESKLVLFYFYGQGSNKKWLNQLDVSGMIPEVKYWNFREKTIEILIKVWEESRIN